MGRPSTGITKQQVVAAAIELADQKGLPAVSIRGVAERLSVAPMTLYNQIANKDELLDGMVEELLRGVHLPPADLRWDERLRQLSCALRNAGHRHPAISQLLLERPVVAPAGHIVTETLLHALRSAGLADYKVLQFEQLMSTWLLGFMASEANGRFGQGSVPVNHRLAILPAEDFPEHHRLGASLRNRDWDREFDQSVQTLIDAIQAPLNIDPPKH